MKKYVMMFLVALTLGFQACNNNDDLWNAIDDLKGRVQALETQVNQLNKNVEALRELYSGKTITNVAVVGDKYILTLSDGTTIELKQGSEADAVMPVVSIDANGYWQVSYDGGKTFQSLGVKATASDGVTPLFRIDEATGYWQVSYDAGATYENVLDTAGNPVKAVGTGSVTDKFFDMVKVSGDVFYIKLLDGTELNIPILKDFFCIIRTDTPGVQKFGLSETKTFRVEIKGVDNALLNAPDGWDVSLSEPVSDEATLTVTAPDQTTRAAADNTKDVSILVTSNNYASISKIQVELDMSAPVPAATVANSTTTLPTASSLTFDVTATDADGWKYICQKSSETAPAANQILINGTAGTGTSVTVNGLDADTKYTLYVIAYTNAQNSAVASVENTTEALPAIDYYEAGYTIGGVTYSKDTPGVKLLDDATTDITAAGVYFLDPQQTTTVYSLARLNTNNVVIIGRHEGAQPKLTIAAIQTFNNAAGGTGYIFKNLDITGATGSYVFNFGGSAGTFDNFVFDDCRVVQSAANQSLSYFNVAGVAIKNTLIRNSRIGMTIATDYQAVRVLNFSNTAVANMQSITFENSIVYTIGNPAGEVAQGTLIWMPSSTATPNLDVKIENNTFVNYIGQPNGFINLCGDKSLSIKKNIFWAPNAYARVSYLLKFSVITTAPPMDIAQNIFYGLASATSWVAYHTGSTYKTDETYPRETTDPFSGGTFSVETGTFIPSAAYAGYGADLK